MTEQERQELAAKLADMSYRKARNYIKRNFPDACLKTFRNGVNREIHTIYELPEHQVKIILVENKKTQPIRRALSTENENPNLYPKRKVDYEFVEVRVIEWVPPTVSHSRG
ncbi:MAG: hypothetical protein CUN55_00060 [Phototrophicales bacterium]|nr:MAG: hypothetical protein CUN55_00060 [Phototrophicales bacterium]